MSDALILGYVSNPADQARLSHLPSPHHHQYNNHNLSTTSMPPTSTTTSFTLHEPTPSPHHQQIPFGRGGAGNRTFPPSSFQTSSFQTSSIPSPSPTKPKTTTPSPPSINNSINNSIDTSKSNPNNNNNTKPPISTGRGGVGNIHKTDGERRLFSFDEELAKEGLVGQVPVYHVGRGGRGNVVGEEREDGGEVTRRRGTWIRVLAGKRI